MKIHKLYKGAPQAQVGIEEPRTLDPKCERCAMHEGAKSVCMMAEVVGAETGGVLLVSDYPGRTEDATGRPMCGTTGRYLRQLLARYGCVDYCLDNGVRCPAGGDDVKDKSVDACRGYLASVVREYKPRRIITLGGVACRAVLGRAIPVLSARKAWGWYFDEDANTSGVIIFRTGLDVPVFVSMNPAAALRNRFVALAFEEDLKYALTCSTPALPPLKAEVRVVETVADACDAVAELTNAKVWVAFDTETSGVLHEPGFRVECISFVAKGARYAWAWDRPAIENEATCRVLRSLLQDSTVPKVGSNTKYDMHACACDPLLGEVAGVHGDVRLWRKLLEPGTAGDLGTMAELVGMGGHKIEAHELVDGICDDLKKMAEWPHKGLTASGKARKRPECVVLRWEAPPEQAILDDVYDGAEPIKYAYRLLDPVVRVRYCALDALSTAMLGEVLEPLVRADAGLAMVWDDITHPTIGALWRMERTGIAIDRGALQTFDAYLATQLTAIDARLSQYGDVNWDSPKQIGELLYEKLKLPAEVKTATGAASTGEEALEALKGKHPIVADITERRRLNTLKKTFAGGKDGNSGMIRHIHSDERIHTSYLQDGTETGRPSSTDPNMNNWPRPKQSAEAKMLCDCIVAPPGKVLLAADQGQVEPRVAARLSGDKAMIADFLSGEDFHLRTAKMIAPRVWGVTDWSKLSKDQQEEYRSRAKSTNFASIYNHPEQLGRMLSYQLDLTMAQGDALAEAFLGRYTRLKAWMKESLHFTRQHGYTHTHWKGKPARRRLLWGVGLQGDEQKSARETAERGAWNSDCQGSAADLTTASLALIQRELYDNAVPAELIFTIYDSIVAEVEIGAERETAGIMRRAMTSWWGDDSPLPLVVDFKLGRSWGSMEKYEP